ncbi:MAG TPA: DUF4347 domain-containing protein, partial [Gemmatimonadaceae bacterium]|nr:DUF4347 domain-containing protein [Gemmatimonadaceae bacterium]
MSKKNELKSANPKRRTGASAVPRRRTRMIALEPRMLFDGALAIDIATAAASEPPAPAPATEAPAPVAEHLAEAQPPAGAESEQASDQPAPGAAKEIVFIDAAVSGRHALLESIGAANARVVVLERSGDAFQQMAEALEGQSGVEAIHIISHGSEGRLILGGRAYSAASIGVHAEQLGRIGAALSSDGDLLLYGCDIAKGSAGEALIQALSETTDADVAASTDATGAEAKGGNWVLEATTGDIDASRILERLYASGYEQVLAAPPIDVGGITLNFDNPALQSGTALQAGAVYKYTDVATIGGIQIDAYITIDGISGATLTTIDNPNPTSYDGSVPGSEVWAPEVNVTTANGRVDFSIYFRDSNGNTLTLLNFVNNTIDIDQVSGTAREFVEYGGFNAYTLSNNTQLAVSQGGGDRLRFTGTGSYNGLLVDERGRVQAEFDAVSTLQISMGGTANLGNRQYGSIFSAVSFTGGGSTTSTPTVDLLTTTDTTPLLTGTIGTTALGSDTFSVTVDGTTYTTSNGLVISGTTWSLQLPNTTAGTYNITATRTFTAPTPDLDVRDQTSGELVINDAPVLSDTALGITTLEDAGAPAGAVGTLVSSLTGGISDPQGAGAAKGIAIIGSDETNGTWYYTTDGGATWTELNQLDGAVSTSNALLLADNAQTRLYFQPHPNWNGSIPAGLTIRAWDTTRGTAGTKLDPGSGGVATAFSVANDTVTLTVTSVPDAPVNTVPAAQAVNQGAPLAFTGARQISVSDAESDVATTQLSVSNGTLVVTLAGGASITAGANGSNTLTLSGGQAAINATLATLVYTSNPAFTGTDTLTVLSTDATSVTDSDTVSILVDSAPVNQVPGAQAVNEDSPLAFTGARLISVSDALNNVNTAQVSVLHGALSVTLSGGASISAGANGSGSLTISGTQAAINATLASLVYQASADYAGADTLTLTSTDSAGLSDTDTVSITVNPVADAPVNVVPGAQTAARNADFYFGAAYGNAVSVSDADTANLTVTVSVTNGTLSLSGTSGLSFSAGDGAGDASMTFSGSQAAINAALEGMRYTPTTNYTGAATLTISSTDGTLSDLNDTVAITVSASLPPSIDLDTGSPVVVAQDDFSSDNYSGGSGWSGNWTEVGDTGGGGATGGNVQTLDPAGVASGGVWLAMENDQNAYVWRSVDLSGYVNASLSFNLAGASLDAADRFAVDVWNGSSWVELQTFAGSNGVTSHTVSLAGYESADTRIAFRIDTNFSNNEFRYVDAVTISAEPDANYVGAVYTEQGAPVSIAAADAIVVDGDSTNLSRMVLAVDGYVAGDRITFDGTAISLEQGATGTTGSGYAYAVSISGDTASLTLTRTTTPANFQTELRAATFDSASDDPTAGGANTTRSISVVAYDSSGLQSNTAVSTVGVAAVADAPTIDAPFVPVSDDFSSGSYAGGTGWSGPWVESESGTATAGDARVTGERLRLETDTWAAREADLSAYTSGYSARLNVDLSFAATTYEAADIAYVEISNDGGATFTVLEQFGNLGSNPAALSRSYDISGQVSDQTVVRFRVESFASGVEFLYVDGVSFSFEPLAYTGTFTEDAGAVPVVDADVEVVDVDSANLNRATVTITNAQAGDVLTVAGVLPAGISIDAASTSSTLILTGSATVADYEAALKQVRFECASDTPDTTARAITITVRDDTNLTSNIAASTINVVAANDAPTVAGAGATLAYTEGAGAQVIDASLTVGDVDGANITSATVTISGGLVSTEDVLAFTAMHGITGSYDAGTGVLALSGTATLAQYEQVLESVTYSNSNASNPDAGARTVTWVVNDGSAGSAGATSTITVAPVNDAPTAAIVPASYAATEQTNLDLHGTGLSVGDVDAGGAANVV